MPQNTAYFDNNWMKTSMLIFTLIAGVPQPYPRFFSSQMIHFRILKSNLGEPLTCTGPSPAVRLVHVLTDFTHVYNV